MTEAGGASGALIRAAAVQYAIALRAKRDLLQTLFYATRNSAAETGTFFRQMQAIQEPREGGTFVIDPGNTLQHMELRGSLSAAEATARDAAWAFMLIIDYSMRRFSQEAARIDLRTYGPHERGVNVNRAIWAFANQARHLHTWIGRREEIRNQPEYQVIEELAYDPLSSEAAREYVCALPINTYIDFEEWLMVTPCALVEETGHRLGWISAGTARIDPPR